MSWSWTSYGAADGVTGSLHRLTTPDGDILLECGLFQGRRKESWELNRSIPPDLAKVKALVLTHAHVDHCGRLPLLVKSGWKGPIYCSPPTADLAMPMMLDSATIMENDFKFMQKHKRDVLPPLFTRADAERVGPLLRPLPFGTRETLFGGISLTLFRSAHILGSAMAFVEQGHENLLFTGDLGSHPAHLLRDREIPHGVRHLVMESTYGARRHKPYNETVESLRMELLRVIDTRGKLLIPSFALERTQHLMALLNRFINTKAIPSVEVVVDSPLGRKLTEAYERHADEYKAPYCQDATQCFRSSSIRFTETVEDSKALNDKGGPLVIIASSGMCEGGRVLHHLLNIVENPHHSILIVGFQAAHTLGRRLVDRVDEVKIYGETRKLRARVQAVNGLSAHADCEGLLHFVEPQVDSLRSIRLVHGEPEARSTLRSKLVQRWPRLEGHVHCEERGETSSLTR
ncbi:MAG: MBL fold metallo-hydrolase [Planctomycetota bacterium]